jgi:hypothetical protein
MFVRAQQRKSGTYHYLVKSVREGGKVRQKTLLYLGQYATVETALEELPKDIEYLKQEVDEWRKEVGQREEVKEYVTRCERAMRECETRLGRLRSNFAHHNKTKLATATKRKTLTLPGTQAAYAEPTGPRR